MEANVHKLQQMEDWEKLPEEVRFGVMRRVLTSSTPEIETEVLAGRGVL